MNSNAYAEISAQVPDMSREFKHFFSWSPSRSLLASIRAYQRHKDSRNPFRVVARKLAVLRHRFWSIVTAADIPINTRIGGGLLLPHPTGVVIHASAEIGPNCLIFSGVVIGARYNEPQGEGIPRIGGHVDIGANATILGAVKIGDNTRIGAGAVVLKDVPSGKTAVGAPAEVVS